MSMNSTDFAGLVTGFLTEYLPLQRNYSQNTIFSYRDTLKLFLRFLQEAKNITPNAFFMKDFKKELVIEFLEWYRNSGAGESAANQRLAAIKAFAGYAQVESIEYMAPLQNVCGIKSRKTASREIDFLTVEQMSKLINLPDVNSHTGFRHRVILTLLYDTGCRVQELRDVTLADIFLGGISTIRLHGKGNKYRTIVISDETAALLRNYIGRYLSRAVTSHPLITNRDGHKIDRDGIAYVVKKYAEIVCRDDHTFPQDVHCHMFRHSKAMHMLEAGINIVYIRDFLGHEDISTTMIYLRTDNRLKSSVINNLAPKVTGEAELPDWNKDKDLLQFLNSLK